MIRLLSEREIESIKSKFVMRPIDLTKPPFNLHFIAGIEFDYLINNRYLLEQLKQKTSLMKRLMHNDAVTMHYIPNYPVRSHPPNHLETVVYLARSKNNLSTPESLIAVMSEFREPGLIPIDVDVDNSLSAPINNAGFYSRMSLEEEVETVLKTDNEWLLNPQKEIIDSTKKFYDEQVRKYDIYVREIGL